MVTTVRPWHAALYSLLDTGTDTDKDETRMSAQKIAFAADIDEETLSDTFGTAPKAVIITVEDGRQVGRDVRDKPFHGPHDHHHHPHDEEHSHDGPAANFAVITDCHALITRRIGAPGIDHAAELGIALFVVRAKTVAEALQAYLEGSLKPL